MEITPEMLRCCSRVVGLGNHDFGNSSDFWLGLQKEYDLRKARGELGERMEQEVRPMFGVGASIRHL